MPLCVCVCVCVCVADPGGGAASGVSLKPLDFWDRRLEYR
jgi:hypothetical protein